MLQHTSLNMDFMLQIMLRKSESESGKYTLSAHTFEMLCSISALPKGAQNFETEKFKYQEVQSRNLPPSNGAMSTTICVVCVK